MRKTTFDIPLFDAQGRLMRYVSRDEASREIARGSWRELSAVSGNYAVALAPEPLR